jgi:class 3 adenylate cyclase
MDNTYTNNIEFLIKESRLCEALDLSSKAMEALPDNNKIAQLYSLTLARLGATEKAKEHLEKLYEKNDRDVETVGLLGRIYKDKWKKIGKIHYARQSRNIYHKGFKATKDYYLGINAATMSLIIGDHEKAKEIANGVIEICKSYKKDYWCLATLGEAHFLIRQAESACKYYRQALEADKVNIGDVNSTFQQLQLISNYMDVPEELFDALKPPSIVVFSGHMIDHPNRRDPRFPEYIAESVKKEIEKTIDKLDVQIGYSSAACGADILFAEAILSRRGELNILLPFRQEDFIKTSVGFAGKQWVDRFHSVVEMATSVKFITEEGYFGNDDIFSYAGQIIQGLSILRAKSLATKPIFLAVIDGSDMKKKQGGTADSLANWPFSNNVELIDLLKLRTKTSPKEFGTKDTKQKDFDFKMPFNITRTHKSIIFADIVGYSKLQEEQTPYFVFEFLQTLAKRLKAFNPQPEILNTWGDAIFAIYEEAADMIEFAFALRDLILYTDWKSKNLPAQMNIRIALHAGPVFQGTDPILKKHSFYGTHISRAARLEPMTVPGCIYASEQFAAKLIGESTDKYAVEYVGILNLPKKFGMQETYHIRRKNEVQ